MGTSPHPRSRTVLPCAKAEGRAGRGWGTPRGRSQPRWPSAQASSSDRAGLVQDPEGPPVGGSSWGGGREAQATEARDAGQDWAPRVSRGWLAGGGAEAGRGRFCARGGRRRLGGSPPVRTPPWATRRPPRQASSNWGQGRGPAWGRLEGTPCRAFVPPQACSGTGETEARGEGIARGTSGVPPPSQA